MSKQKEIKCETCPEKIFYYHSKGFKLQTPVVAEKMPLLPPDIDGLLDKYSLIKQHDKDQEWYKDEVAAINASWEALLETQKKEWVEELDAAAIHRNALEIEINELRDKLAREAGWLMKHKTGERLVAARNPETKEKTDYHYLVFEIEQCELTELCKKNEEK